MDVSCLHYNEENFGRLLYGQRSSRIDDCVLEIDEDGGFIVCDAAYLKALCPEDHSAEAGFESRGEA